MLKHHLIHLIGYFDGYYQIRDFFPTFGRKKFLHDTFLRSLGLMNRGGGTKEKRVSLKGPKQTGIGSETGIC